MQADPLKSYLRNWKVFLFCLCLNIYTYKFMLHITNIKKATILHDGLIS